MAICPKADFALAPILEKAPENFVFIEPAVSAADAFSPVKTAFTAFSLFDEFFIVLKAELKELPMDLIPFAAAFTRVTAFCTLLKCIAAVFAELPADVIALFAVRIPPATFFVALAVLLTADLAAFNPFVMP